MLNKNVILEAQDLPYEDVEVPEWGGTVRIQGLNATDVIAFGSSLVKIGPDGQAQEMNQDALDNVMAKLMVKTIVDEKFKRVFSDADAEALGKKSAKVLQRLSEVATRLSGLGNNAVQAAAKNSDATPADASPSA